VTEQENESQGVTGADAAGRPAAVDEAAPDDGVPGVVEAPGAADAEIEALRQALTAQQEQAAAAQNEVLRARAEIDNLRKRTVREVENAHKYGQERFVTEMLPVKDGIELGMAAAASATDVAALREGMALTLKSFVAAFDKLGVAEVNPVGERFNAELHQAIAMQPAAVEPGTVLTVVQKGYRLNERLIRPAMVIVARAPE